MQQDLYVKERVGKRVFDLIAASLLLVVLSPILLVVVMLLKLEGFINPSYRGPVFYKETRVSKGRSFGIYKFRIVKSDILKQLRECDGKKSITEFTNDRAYLTPVGIFLAKVYFDELPQLFNILKGQMSFVGPRPHFLPHHENDLKKGIVSAQYIKAGIAGLVQASKGNSPMAKELARIASGSATRYDMAAFADTLYFRKYRESSAIEMLFYDIKIIFGCLLVVLRARGLASQPFDSI